MLTNTTPTGAYRGAGRPEAIYLIERLMDAAARKLKMDPAELRRRVTSPNGTTEAAIKAFQAGGFEALVDQALLDAWKAGKVR